jgi:hypothetical protein
MDWMHELAYFGGGVFLANAIPHVVSGLMGRPFQSPFATPRGEGLSTSTINVVWGFANLVVAYFLICHVGEFDLRSLSDAGALGLGMLLFGVVSARLFGRFHGGNAPPQGRTTL